MDADLARLSVNTIRTLSIDAVQKADSGHPGLPLGAAPMSYVLWQQHLRHDPSDPHWPDRDRFVLSAGHGSALLYSLLHLAGYPLSLDQLKAFRQWGSLTPGHPEWHHTPGVEATTGPLGQGSANAVGMAIAERYLGTLFNRPGHTIVDHHTYALVSDGDLMEGVSCEAGSLAGHLGLGKLIYLYDANHVTLDGPLDIAFSEDVAARYGSYGWQVLHVDDGDHDLAALDRALAEARADTARPSIIIVHTTIGFGSPKKAGTSKAHGSPLGVDEVRATKVALGWDPDRSFYVPDEVRAHMAEPGARGQAAHAAWRERFAAWRAAHPELATQWDQAWAGELPAGLDAALPAWKEGDKLATRVASGKVMVALAAAVPWLFGGDADLGGSTKTIVPGGDYDRAGAGRNLRFGIREHAMGSICNGMAYHGGLHPFAATFFVFSDYMRPPVRIAALNGQRVTYVWTHDSIGLGEDGPTHQPVEHLMALRAMPNLAVFRPGDANETAAGWRVAMTRAGGPVALVLSRQDLPVMTAAGAPGAERGAYVLAEASGGAPQVVLIGTGSEVSLAMEARAALEAAGVATRVVSMPCWELFAEQDDAYRAQVLPAGPPRVAVEAGVTMGWREWVGDRGAVIGLDRYGASAPGETLMAKLGITVDAVVAAAKRLLA
ncbi:MAG: transketolase [Kofleriaceae bacterium]|nr:transketolase [Myxococcales bacterium]MCB9564725.1 transketolase [Kofleriaceae bacterium]MCB9573960.1 transketolase [Kofleriaceae bacterium]